MEDKVNEKNDENKKTSCEDDEELIEKKSNHEKGRVFDKVKVKRKDSSKIDRLNAERKKQKRKYKKYHEKTVNFNEPAAYNQVEERGDKELSIFNLLTEKINDFITTHLKHIKNKKIRLVMREILFKKMNPKEFRKNIILIQITSALILNEV